MFGKGSTLAAKVFFIKVVPLPLGVSFLGNGGTVLQSLFYNIFNSVSSAIFMVSLYCSAGIYNATFR